MLFKRVLNLALCFILGLSSVAQAQQLSLNLPEPSIQEQKVLIAQSDDLFKKGGLAKHYLRKAAHVGGQFALNRAHSAAIGGVQTVLVGGVSMLIISMQLTCEQKKIKNEQDCFDSEVVANNFGLAVNYMASSGEFYAGMLGGGVAAALVIDVVNFLLRNSKGISFLKSFLLGAVQSTVLYLGFSFPMQLWKESMNYLNEEERALAHGLIPRLALQPFDAASGQFELAESDKALFNKIVGVMTDLLVKSPEVRNSVIYNWWRLEVATGKGLVSMASAIPAFTYMLYGMSSGSSMGPKGMVIAGALGLLGGVAAALLPEEYTHQMTLGLQNLRSWGRERNLYVNGTELKRILSYYQKDASVGFKDESKDRYRENDFTSFMNQRLNIRNDFSTIVYERVFTAQTLIDELERNIMIAKNVLSNLELRDSLARSLAINKDGKFTYAENQIDKNVFELSKEGKYQRELIKVGPQKIAELKEFIKKEITSIYEFYNKESDFLGDLSVKNYNVASPTMVLSLSNDSAKAKILKDKNKNIIYALVMQNVQDKQQQLNFLKASADMISYFRDRGFDEDLLLSPQK